MTRRYLPAESPARRVSLYEWALAEVSRRADRERRRLRIAEACVYVAILALCTMVTLGYAGVVP